MGIYTYRYTLDPITGYAPTRSRVGIKYTLNGVVCPTLELVETFYSENGVPIEEDINYDYANRHKLRHATSADRWYVKEGEETAILHFNREPRFYAILLSTAVYGGEMVVTHWTKNCIA